MPEKASRHFENETVTQKQLRSIGKGQS